MRGAVWNPFLAGLFFLCSPGLGAQSPRVLPDTGDSAQGPRPIPTSIVHQPLPECADNCATEFYQTSKCSKTDWDCLCDHGWVSRNMTVCFQAGCFPSTTDFLMTLNFTTADCDMPAVIRPPRLKATASCLGVFTIFCVVLRLLERSDRRHKWRERTDDWVMTLNLMFLIAFTTIGIELTRLGMGRDSWTLPSSKLELFMKLTIAHQTFYVSIVYLTKLSILFVYYRIFPLQVMSSVFRISIPITMGVVAMAGIGQALAFIFQCTPVSFFWTSMEDLSLGNCTDITDFGWANAAINVILDIWLIALPLPELIKLKLYWKKKVKVVLMMVVACLVIFISVPRLFFMDHFVRSYNPTLDLSLIAFLSSLEAYIGVVCACLPRIYILFSRIYRKTGWASTLPDGSSSLKTWPALSTLRSAQEGHGRPGRLASDATAEEPAGPVAPTEPPAVLAGEGQQLAMPILARSTNHGGGSAVRHRGSRNPSVASYRSDEDSEDSGHSILQALRAVSSPSSAYQGEGRYPC